MSRCSLTRIAPHSHAHSHTPSNSIKLNHMSPRCSGVVGLVFGAGIAFYQRRPFLKYTASVGGNFTIGSFCFFCKCVSSCRSRVCCLCLVHVPFVCMCTAGRVHKGACREATLPFQQPTLLCRVALLDRRTLSPSCHPPVTPLSPSCRPPVALLSPSCCRPVTLLSPSCRLLLSTLLVLTPTLTRTPTTAALPLSPPLFAPDPAVAHPSDGPAHISPPSPSPRLPSLPASVATLYLSPRFTTPPLLASQPARRASTRSAAAGRSSSKTAPSRGVSAAPCYWPRTGRRR